MSENTKLVLIALGGYALYNYAKGRPLLYVPSGISKNVQPGRAPQQFDPGRSVGDTNNLIQSGFQLGGQLLQTFNNVWNKAGNNNGIPDVPPESDFARADSGADVYVGSDAYQGTGIGNDVDYGQYGV